MDGELMLKRVDCIILRALVENCRFNDSVIAKISGLRRSTVKKRIAFLEKEGIIQKYFTNIYCSAVGIIRYLDVYFEAKTTEDMIKKICDFGEVVRVTVYSGKWSLGITLSCSTMEHSKVMLEKIKTILGNNFISLVVLQFNKSRYLERDYFLEGLNIKNMNNIDCKGSYQKLFKKSKNFFPKGIQALSKIDLRILELLRHNARISITELAKLLRIDRISVDKRIRMLVEKHIISHFTITIDYQRLGFQKINVFLQLNCSDEQKNLIISELKTLSGGYFYAEFVSEWDLMFTIITKNSSQTIKEIEHIKSKYENFIKRETILHVLKECKHSAFPENLSQIYENSIIIFAGGGQLLSHKNLSYSSLNKKHSLMLHRAFYVKGKGLISFQQTV